MMNKIEKWAYGLVGGCIGGGASAAVAWISMTAAKAAGVDVPSLNIKAIGVIFLSGIITNGLSYLAKSPLPPVDDTTPTP